MKVVTGQRSASGGRWMWPILWIRWPSHFSLGATICRYILCRLDVYSLQARSISIRSMSNGRRKPQTPSSQHNLEVRSEGHMESEREKKWFKFIDKVSLKVLNCFQIQWKDGNIISESSKRSLKVVWYMLYGNRSLKHPKWSGFSKEQRTNRNFKIYTKLLLSGVHLNVMIIYNLLLHAYVAFAKNFRINNGAYTQESMSSSMLHATRTQWQWISSQIPLLPVSKDIFKINICNIYYPLFNMALRAKAWRCSRP